jgi:UDP-3-O-[3-hydroxymyristoyl] N-acetylglucosamine deacetylase
MKAVLQGSCLSGGHSKVEVSTSDRFKLLHHADSRPPISIPLDVDNIAVENNLFPYLPSSQSPTISSPTSGGGQRRGYYTGGGLRRGSFVSVGQEPGIQIVEHLFSALYGMNLFNVKIDVFGNEIPFFDGSSQKFVEMLGQLREQNLSGVLRLDNNILVAEGTSFILYEPLEKDTLIIEMELFHPYIKSQSICLEINKENYLKEIAPARTFAFVNENDPRIKNLPPYGIGITKNNIYSKKPLRFQNELVRHKLLDLLGDLYVLQKRLVGKITSRNTSHLLNLEFVSKIVGCSLQKH